MSATGEGFPSSPVLLRVSGVVVSEPNLGVQFKFVEEVERLPGVRTGVVAGPARSSVG